MYGDIEKGQLDVWNDEKKHQDEEIIVKLHKTSVWPHQEYCVKAWNPYMCEKGYTVEPLES